MTQSSLPLTLLNVPPFHCYNNLRVMIKFFNVSMRTEASASFSIIFAKDMRNNIFLRLLLFLCLNLCLLSWSLVSAAQCTIELLFIYNYLVCVIPSCRHCGDKFTQKVKTDIFDILLSIIIPSQLQQFLLASNHLELYEQMVNGGLGMCLSGISHAQCVCRRQFKP